ncbi:hypothetical protein [Streptococcus equi]|uniref:hypothetical protein n=1 Tax=Streptococcus equi TaxID=1336 RepID=UPI00398471B3
MIYKENYIHWLTDFLGASLVSKGDNVSVSDGVDIIYCMEKREDKYDISISERGKVITQYRVLNSKLARLYYILLVKKALTTIKYPLLNSIGNVDSEELLRDQLNSEGLENYYSINKNGIGKVNFQNISKDRLYYLDNKNNAYDIFFVSTKVLSVFYTSIVRLKWYEKWIEQLSSIEDISSDLYPILLGFSHEGIEIL